MSSSPRRSFSTDKLVGIAAFIISIGTFVVYIYEANLIRTQQYASVLPYLEMWNSRVNDEEYRLILVNNGIGPAFVKEIRVRYKGKTYEGDHTDFHYAEVYPKDTLFRFISSNVRAGRVIPAGQQVELISIQNNLRNADRAFELYGEQQAEIEIVYASVYDEKWKIIGMSGPPQKLE
ncbi:MAG: hypothetical protein MUD08_07495 [Cytophagales bacterium]|jgi:hypothetical protein|nr:hypothetical protein [Cytophagales bacterium]